MVGIGALTEPASVWVTCCDLVLALLDMLPAGYASSENAPCAFAADGAAKLSTIRDLDGDVHPSPGLFAEGCER
jgi:hypothetical protein